MCSEKTQPLEYASPSRTRPLRPMALVGIAVVAVFSGAVLGVLTNAVNGAVSPTYFINVMGWQSVTNVWFTSIMQGAFEGTAVGLFFSVILTTSIGIISRATCSFALGLRWLGFIVAGIFALWIVGGFSGMALASLNPNSFRTTFVGVPGDRAQMLRYAWVGGSIWGAEFGGFAAIIVGLILFRIKWRKMLLQQTG